MNARTRSALVAAAALVVIGLQPLSNASAAPSSTDTQRVLAQLRAEYRTASSSAGRLALHNEMTLVTHSGRASL